MKTLKEIELERFNADHFDGYTWYKPVDAACSKCGSQLYINDTVVLTSYPPQYQYICKNCGNVENSTLRIEPCYK